MLLISLLYGGHFSFVFCYSSIRQNIHWGTLAMEMKAARRWRACFNLKAKRFSYWLFYCSLTLHALLSYGKGKFSCRKEENAFTKQFIESAHFSPSIAISYGVDKEDKQKMQYNPWL
jgi:hypothetical protein